jgi:hypothetical protein
LGIVFTEFILQNFSVEYSVHTLQHNPDLQFFYKNISVQKRVEKLEILKFKKKSFVFEFLGSISVEKTYFEFFYFFGQFLERDPTCNFFKKILRTKKSRKT